MNDYYVYVYIDPRNFEEFYYGKGKGSRKDAHLKDGSGSDKSLRILAIQTAGQQPIIRVIARNLEEKEALLVEKTLLWKSGKTLDNDATGHFADKFRPKDKLHLELTGFDFENGVYYFNVGEGDHRLWVDCKRFGFISAGGSPRWRDAIYGFRQGDVLAAYLKGAGFVGIGKIVQPARPIRDVTIGGVPLLKLGLSCKNMDRGVDSNDECEHVALVEWIKTVDRDQAIWKAKSNIYTTTHVRASLDGQQATLKFLAERFGVDFKALVL